MRRTAPALPVPPKLLKHFAAATLAITLLIALFASGEDWGARAQIHAAEGKNRLLKTEAEKLGTAKLVDKLKIANKAGNAHPDDGGDVAPEIAPAVSGGTSATAPYAAQPDTALPSVGPFVPNLPRQPGASITIRGMNVDYLPNADPAKRKRKAAQAFTPPTAAQRAAMREDARRRSGAQGNEGE